MTEMTPWKCVVLLCFFGLTAGRIAAQDCADPALLCPMTATDTLDYTQGAPVPVPPDFCFDDAPNAVFYSFRTLDTDQFPSIQYTDSSAVLYFTVDSCLADTALGIAVFEAPDPCDPDSYGPPVICTTDTMGQGMMQLQGLKPSTTYHVMVTGLMDTTGVASECVFNVAVQGPALEYDLDAKWYPASFPTMTILFQGNTAILTADGSFGELQWSGPGLESTTGPEVSANPEGNNTTVTYTVDATINGCVFYDEVLVPIRPPIIPFNTFTPNGDGYNDTWEIGNIQRWPNAQIFVYSRWGNKVFQATNYNNDWDGDDLPAATYYFAIELNPIDFNAEPITGSVTILR